MILDFFSTKPDHPLADARELRRAVTELPLDNAYKAVDEVLAWLESLQTPTGFKADHLFDTVRQLDEAAQPHLRRLQRDYLHSPRLSKTEEKRLWSANHAFWQRLANLYEQCLEKFRQKEKGAEGLKPHRPLLLARLILALGSQLKWRQYHYAPVNGLLWQRLGAAYLQGEKEGVDDVGLVLYPGAAVSTSPRQEYLKVLMLHASSMDSLLPLEIELAERIITHCLPEFIFRQRSGPESVYGIDPALPDPPFRLLREPQPSPTLRFLSPGTAAATLAALIDDVQRQEVPGDLNLGGQYTSRQLLPVLQHLALHWAPSPPLREHQRHAVKTHLSVLNGFDNVYRVFTDQGEVERGAESWIADNVSRGGFGAQIAAAPGDWLRIGALLAMQPEGGNNWLLGIIRRYGRDSDTQACVGIQTLARQVEAVELQACTAAPYALTPSTRALLLREGRENGEVHLVMPPATFDATESLCGQVAGQPLQLAPLELLESGRDYEIARYREMATAA